MSALHIFILTTFLVSEISCKGFYSKSKSRQLFLSRRVVTDSGEFDGGVLVDENGIISGIYTRESIDELTSDDDYTLQVIDGGEWALMAGVVDSHVHVNEPGRTSWEGYVTATKAAAAGGITTLVDMPLNSFPPTTSVENLKVKASSAREEVYIDVAFWGGIIPGNEMELQNMIEAGVIGFKAYLIDSGITEFPNVEKDELDNIFSTLNGSDIVIAFHTELPISASDDDTQCEKCDRPDPNLYSTYLASHPPEMELKAASLLASYIPKYDVHVHVVHVSAEGVIPILEAAREERIKAGSKRWRGGVTAETCHHYLTLSSEQIPPGHTEFKCSPPIRNITNKQRLWQYIQERRIDLIASDHSPSVATMKGSNFMTAWGGIASVQFGLSLFWTEAKARGLSLSTVSHYLSSGPAHLCGLQNRKGTIKPGLDADLVFFDPEASFVVTPEIIFYKNKLSPYMYRVLTGKVRKTYLRGQLVYTDGNVFEKPQGQLLINYTALFNITDTTNLKIPKGYLLRNNNMFPNNRNIAIQKKPQGDLLSNDNELPNTRSVSGLITPQLQLLINDNVLFDTTTAVPIMSRRLFRKYL
ncbi:allantoinase-like isoform X1 [Nymphalis io]|uniref:allantoinase-like isoform X1 n=1 Tax=Inachis io TaxID=171585 RepID=UPI00216910C8|nr:allantoinase-like isoform X1 [Nymphalis io]